MFEIGGTYANRKGKYTVEAVKMTVTLKDVYIIRGRAYYVWYFKVIT